MLKRIRNLTSPIVETSKPGGIVSTRIVHCLKVRSLESIAINLNAETGAVSSERIIGVRNVSPVLALTHSRTKHSGSD